MYVKGRIIRVEGVSSVICFIVRDDKRENEGGTKGKKWGCYSIQNIPKETIFRVKNIRVRGDKLLLSFFFFCSCIY